MSNKEAAEIATVPTLPIAGVGPDAQADLEAEVKKEHVYDEMTVMKSPFEDLGFWDTMMRFRKATAMALVAAFTAAAEYVPA